MATLSCEHSEPVGGLRAAAHLAHQLLVGGTDARWAGHPITVLVTSQPGQVPAGRTELSMVQGTHTGKGSSRLSPLWLPLSLCLTELPHAQHSLFSSLHSSLPESSRPRRGTIRPFWLWKAR